MPPVLTLFFVSFVLDIASPTYTYPSYFRDNNVQADAEVGISFPPPTVEENPQVSQLIATLKQRGTEQVEQWAFAGLLVPEIRGPLYTSINFPAVNSAAISSNDRPSYGRLNNLE